MSNYNRAAGGRCRRVATISIRGLGYFWDKLKVHLEWLRSCGLGSPGLDNIRSHIGYTLPCDRMNRVPYWVFEHLTKES